MKKLITIIGIAALCYSCKKDVAVDHVCTECYQLNAWGAASNQKYFCGTEKEVHQYENVTINSNVHEHWFCNRQ